MNRFSTLEPVLDVKANCILDELSGFLLGFAFGIAPLQRRDDRDKPPILVALDHNGELVEFHGIASDAGTPTR
jgi:hypothetical protein